MKPLCWVSMTCLALTLGSSMADAQVRSRSGSVAKLLTLPREIHFCDVNCSTLVLRDREYVSIEANGSNDPRWTDVWTVEHFTRDSVVFRRTETGTYAFTVFYTGQLSPDGSRLINAANPFGASGGQPAYVQMAWGGSLNAVYGSNRQRDVAQFKAGLGQIFSGLDAAQKLGLLGDDSESSTRPMCQRMPNGYVACSQIER